MLLASMLGGCKLSEQPERQGPSEDEIAKRLLRISEASLSSKRASDAPALPWEQLGALLPERLGQQTATGPAEGVTDTTVTKVSKASRRYATAEQQLTIDLSDVSQNDAIMLSLLVQHASAKANETDAAGNMISSTRVGVHPALARFTSSTKQATVTIAVARRFVVEATVTPVDDIANALMIAGSLPLEALANIAAVAEAAQAAPEPPPEAPSEGASSQPAKVEDPDLL